MAGFVENSNPATNHTPDQQSLAVPRLALIEALIRQSSDRQKIKRLNWLWWKEFFKAVKQPDMRKAA